MSIRPTVSIVIPTFNRANYLRATAASACAQTFRDTEILVSDDASDQDPARVLDALADDRIRLVRHPHGGMWLNTIRGIHLARGKYLAVLNDDDLWHPHFLERLIAPLELDSRLVLSFCDTHIIRADGSIDEAATHQNARRRGRLGLHPGCHAPFHDLALVSQAVVPACAAVFRREAVPWEEMPQGAGVYWDLYTSYLACRAGLGACYIPDRLACYRVHGGAESAVSGGRDARAKLLKGQAGVFCYQAFLDDIRLRQFHPCFRRRWAHYATTLAIALLRLDRASEARPLLLRSLRRRPTPRTAAALALSLLPHRIAAPLLNPRATLRGAPR